MNEKYSIYSINFIVYLILSTLLIIASLILIKKYVKKESTLNLIIKIIAGVLLLVILINRIAYTYQFIYVDKRGDEFTWWYLIPETFCGLTSLSLALTALIGKRNNILFQALVFFALFGGLIAGVYPNYLAIHPFYSLRAFTSLLNHTLMIFLSLLMLLTKYVKPNIKRWYVTPIVYGVFVIFGLFEMQVLSAPPDSMSIFVPLIPNTSPILDVLTSWYMMGIGVWIASFIITIIYQHFVDKDSFRKIFNLNRRKHAKNIN